MFWAAVGCIHSVASVNVSRYFLYWLWGAGGREGERERERGREGERERERGREREGGTRYDIRIISLHTYTQTIRRECQQCPLTTRG